MLANQASNCSSLQKSISQGSKNIENPIKRKRKKGTS
jgi:hypothetical protein